MLHPHAHGHRGLRAAQGMVARALSAEPLVWVGKRSYSIYLWHYPLLLLMNPVANINDTPWWQYILQVLWWSP